MSLTPEQQELYDRVKRRLTEAERTGLELQAVQVHPRYFGHDLNAAIMRAERREFRQLIHDAVLEKGCTSATGALTVLIEELLASDKVKPAHVQHALQGASVGRAAGLDRRLVPQGDPINEGDL